MTSTRRWLMTLFLAVLAGVVRAGDQDFTLVNKTGVEIHHVFVSPSDKNEWEEDILGEDTLPSGESVDIEFETDEDAELWDIKITDGDGGAIVWKQLNLLKISKLTLLYDAETKKATAKAE
jgi:hypothetical protein